MLHAQPDCYSTLPSSPPSRSLKPKVIQVCSLSLTSEFFYCLMKRLGRKCGLIIPEKPSAVFPGSLGAFSSFCFFSSRSFHTSSLQFLLCLGATVVRPAGEARIAADLCHAPQWPTSAHTLVYHSNLEDYCSSVWDSPDCRL